jgi:hypothetical protein
LEALLSKAKSYLTKGDERYRLAREAIVDAKRLDPNLSNRSIAKSLGRSHRWVNGLLKWSGTEGSTPFEKEPSSADTSEPSSDQSDRPFVLRKDDAVVMGGHVLFIGDSTTVRSKLDVFDLAGLPFLKEFIDPDAAEERDGNVAVLTDPPYGVSKRGILNDHEADWREVYRLFQPIGGFAFAAYKPPEFLTAQRGIEKAGWVVRHYLAMHNAGGRPWEGRVQNSIDAIFFFEREGESIWPAGRITPSLLKPDRSWAARQERTEIAAGHRTSKPVGLLMKLMEIITEPGGIVLDPFAGSGSGLIACERAGRKFIGIELERDHAENAVRTWQRETGADAIVHRDFIGGPVRYDDMKPDHPNDLYIGEDGDYHYRDEASTSARR